MTSKLTKRIEELELRLRQQDDSVRTLSSYKELLELTGFVYDLSRKIDQLETARV
jgi:hypothetical protein